MNRVFSQDEVPSTNAFSIVKEVEQIFQVYGWVFFLPFLKNAFWKEFVTEKVRKTCLKNPICKCSLSRLKSYRCKLMQKLFQQLHKAAREGKWQDPTATPNANEKIGLLSVSEKLLESENEREAWTEVKLNFEI